MRRLALLAACLLVATACNGGGGDGQAQGSPTPAAPTRTLKPVTEERPYRIQVVSPATDTAVQAGDVTVTVTLQGFALVDKLGEAPKKGEGHIHYYLDVEEMPTEKGKPAVTDDERTYHATADTTHTWKDVEAGEHIFGVQLVNNDHTPLDPPEIDDATVRVRE